MKQIALIEDNREFRAEVAFHLRHAGFEVVLEHDGLNLDIERDLNTCEVVVLDLGLPLCDGISIAKTLRDKHPELGIVMLTARGSLEARIKGLEIGADAYLVKPIDMRELVAAIRSLERRLPLKLSTSLANSWRVNELTHTLTTPSGIKAALTGRETSLLVLLAHAKGSPTSRRNLAIAIGEDRLDFDHRRLEVTFSRLRQKIEQIEPQSNVIRSSRGQGYIFAAPLIVEKLGD